MRQYLISIFACSAIYYISFVLNMLFFDFYIHSYGVNWVFMPSGVQLVLVLIAVESAAIAIAIVSWIIGFYYFFTGSVFFTLITGIIAGLSPLLARKVAFDYLKIEDDLKNLTFIGILKTSIIFASRA